VIKNTDNKNLKSIRIDGNINEQGENRKIEKGQTANDSRTIIDNRISSNREMIKGFDGLEIAEDTTKYGEFVSSYFAWVGLDKQKEIVDRIENITKNR